MAKLKTKPTEILPADYIASISPASKQLDAQWLLETCERLTGEKAKMWGASIIGSGSYHYSYESGREGDMVLCGFSPRKAALVVYLAGNIDDQAELLEKLGPHKMGKSCLYIKHLTDVDLDILEALMQKSIDATLAKYPANQIENS
ncbi:hypothetical protein MNBD_ALPHA11-1744 [hydrothermal vent metagenome]|uniref:YdhG-like domain-containing protein n=1 Tax=hydrothermal vent metagenome TaxID=652676 RepID=A0A3B0UN33_9ZZZZ